MTRTFQNVIDLEKYPLGNNDFRIQCKRTLDKDGALVMRDFVKPAVIVGVRSEGEAQQRLAYYTVDQHNIYLEPSDARYPSEHPRNRAVSSSKGCITTDQIPGAARSL